MQSYNIISFYNLVKLLFLQLKQKNLLKMEVNQAVSRKKKSKFKWNKFWKTIGIAIICCIAFSIILSLVYSAINPPITILMVKRTIEQIIDKDREVRFKKEWVDLNKISPNMIKAVIHTEDQNFYNHNGFDWKAIERAIEHNKVSKRKRGASTISQQTAKNVFLWPGRDWIRKGLEVYYTVLIETFWSKKRITEVYLNVIEFGDGIYGIEAASEHYFNKNASNLTKSESMALAKILPNPLYRTPKKKKK